jgi:hypothetical protein
MLSMAGRFRIALTFAALAISSRNWAAEAPALNYDRDIRPILSENCFQCHGQDSKKRMAGLQLDSVEGAIADRQGHAALVPGNPEASAIYQRITSDQRAESTINTGSLFLPLGLLYHRLRIPNGSNSQSMLSCCNASKQSA